MVKGFRDGKGDDVVFIRNVENPVLLKMRRSRLWFRSRQEDLEPVPVGLEAGPAHLKPSGASTDLLLSDPP
jgi:hypothetical protein